MDSKKSQQHADSVSHGTKSTSRRDFLARTAALSVSALAGTSLMASQEGESAILEPQPWGQKWGDPITKNLYGVPSKYEHNVKRRYTKLLASGNFRASIAVTPIQESSGIITPNCLFFSRSHGGVAQIDPNEHRLMITGLVENL